jgi:hypothetical protein
MAGFTLLGLHIGRVNYNALVLLRHFGLALDVARRPALDSEHFAGFELRLGRRTAYFSQSGVAAPEVLISLDRRSTTSRHLNFNFNTMFFFFPQRLKKVRLFREGEK